MADDNQASDGKIYKLKRSYWRNFKLGVQESLNDFLRFFSLRSTRQFWGIVYDSVSKQPLDPVIVKLMYADSREIQTVVTDLSGRYGFLARPGKFKIFVRKSHYSFPSRWVLGDSDGIYHNLYHGEFFTLQDDAEVVGPNIPMDPDQADWNQGAKLSLVNARFGLQLLVNRLAAAVFWFLVILVAICLWKFFPKEPLWLESAAAFLLLVLILAGSLAETRLWGQVKGPYGPPADTLVLELFNPEFPSIILGKAITQEDGKFLLRTAPGRYVLVVSRLNQEKEKILIKRIKIRVGWSGVYNRTLRLKVIRTAKASK